VKAESRQKQDETEHIEQKKGRKETREKYHISDGSGRGWVRFF
jgi:hypothetical protein